MTPTDPDPLRRLSPDQRALLHRWFPTHQVVADLSWGLVDSWVLQLRAEGADVVVKAVGPQSGHINREVRAHREWLDVWRATEQAPRLLHEAEAEQLLATEYLPGVLVEGTAAQRDPELYRQAGQLLARFHAQLTIEDPDYETHQRDRALAFLDRPHRIAADIEQQVRAEIATWPTGTTTVVPTHGDWQPRNWLVDEGTIRIIDFGRADLRRPLTDLARLERQDFDAHPQLASAFFEGYGADPREPVEWRRTLLQEAIGTAVWAYQVGDEQFERVGHRALGCALQDT